MQLTRVRGHLCVELHLFLKKTNLLKAHSAPCEASELEEKCWWSALRRKPRAHSSTFGHDHILFFFFFNELKHAKRTAKMQTLQFTHSKRCSAQHSKHTLQLCELWNAAKEWTRRYITAGCITKHTAITASEYRSLVFIIIQHAGKLSLIGLLKIMLHSPTSWSSDRATWRGFCSSNRVLLHLYWIWNK